MTSAATNKSPYRLTVEIKGLPKMPNAFLRGHWRNAHSNKQRWQGLLIRKVGAHIPPEPLKRAKLTLTRHSSVEPDFDGLVGSFKFASDALVRIGVLENDTMAVIGQPEYRHEKVKQNAGKITVTVEEI